jgi:hypothetical protein
MKRSGKTISREFRVIFNLTFSIGYGKIYSNNLILEAIMSKLKTLNIQHCLKSIKENVNGDAVTNAKAMKSIEHLELILGGSADDVQLESCGKAVVSILDQIASGCN